uniref:Sporozoite surface protein 2-like n=1 Tax=Rhabditophanes sp. KR3021 TaxID=114890 RepID=A0AC35UGQ8_9BILA
MSFDEISLKYIFNAIICAFLNGVWFNLFCVISCSRKSEFESNGRSPNFRNSDRENYSKNRHVNDREFEDSDDNNEQNESKRCSDDSGKYRDSNIKVLKKPDGHDGMQYKGGKYSHSPREESVKSKTDQMEYPAKSTKRVVLKSCMRDKTITTVKKHLIFNNNVVVKYIECIIPDSTRSITSESHGMRSASESGLRKLRKKQRNALKTDVITYKSVDKSIDKPIYEGKNVELDSENKKRNNLSLAASSLKVQHRKFIKTIPHNLTELNFRAKTT